MRFFDQFKKGESVLNLGYLAVSKTKHLKSAVAYETLASAERQEQ